MTARDSTPADPPAADPSRRREKTKTARFAGLMGAGILLSRLLGLVRDMFLAYFLGTGHVAEAWLVAFRIPNVLRMHLTEGSLNAAFVPIFNEYLERGDAAETRAMASSACTALGLFLTMISLLGSLVAPEFVHLLAPGFVDVPGKVELTANLMRWTFFYIALVGVAALLMGMLQSLGSFRTSALAQAVFNTAIIVSVFTICPLFGEARERWVYGLVVGSLLGGLVQLLIQIPPLVRAGFLPQPTRRLDHPGVRRIARLMGPTFFGVAIAEIMILANTFLASLLSEGAVAAIEYATRIIQMPYMVLAGAISTAMLPLMSKQSARRDYADLTATLSFTLRAIVFLMVPVGVVTAVLDTEIVQLVLERGAFSAESTARTAHALRFFVPLLLGSSALRLVTAAFFSMQDTRTPVWVSALALVFNVALGAVLMRVMDVAGLALAVSLSPCLASATLLIILSRRVGGFPLVGWPRTLLAVLSGSAVLTGVLLVVARGIEPALGGVPPAAAKVTRLAIPSIVGLGAYLGIGTLWRTEELAFVSRTIGRRLGVVR